MWIRTGVHCTWNKISMIAQECNINTYCMGFVLVNLAYERNIGMFCTWIKDECVFAKNSDWRILHKIQIGAYCTLIKDTVFCTWIKYMWLLHKIKIGVYCPKLWNWESRMRFIFNCNPTFSFVSMLRKRKRKFSV